MFAGKPLKVFPTGRLPVKLSGDTIEYVNAGLPVVGGKEDEGVNVTLAVSAVQFGAVFVKVKSVTGFIGSIVTKFKTLGQPLLSFTVMVYLPSVKLQNNGEDTNGRFPML